MEIKTCEQFIINRFMELENAVEMQKDVISEQTCRIQELEEKLAFVCKFLYVNKAYNWSPENNSTYIEFNSIWKNSNPKDYNRMCEIFGLTESDEEED